MDIFKKLLETFKKLLETIKESRKKKHLGLGDILIQVTLADCKDDNEGWIQTDRIGCITNLLHHTSFKLVYSGKHSLLYSNCTKIRNDLPCEDPDLLRTIQDVPVEALTKDDNITFLSCHIDSVPEPFFKKEDGKLRGTFDNAVTCAVLIYAMREGLLPRNTVVAFTGGEEHQDLGMLGAKEICERFIEHGPYHIPCVVVTDVTGEFFDKGYDISIENPIDFDLMLGRQIFNSLDQKVGPNKYGYQHFMGMDGPLDETIAYAESIPTIAVCLPVGDPDKMHSPEGVLIRFDEMHNYLRGLLAVLHTISSEGIDYRWK